MLSPNVLNRASDAYRRGYMDGYYGHPSQTSAYGEFTFGRTDYGSGYDAGANDAQHSITEIMRVRDTLANLGA
jgi:hypothetical protein